MIEYETLYKMRDNIKICQESLKYDQQADPQTLIKVARKAFLIIEQLIEIVIEQKDKEYVGDED